MAIKVSPPARWLTPVREVWEAHNGKGTLPWGIAGKALKPLREFHDDEEIARYLDVYLKRTDPRFINLFKFAATFAQYDPAQLEIALVDEFGMLTDQ